MGNLICCQSDHNDTQIKIDRLIAEDKLFYSNKKNTILHRNKGQYDNKKLKYLQANIKSRQFRLKFKKLLRLTEFMLKSELKVNLVENLKEIIKGHSGNILIKQYEEIYGVFTPINRKYKYIITYEAVYIDKTKNEDIYIGSWSLSKKFQGYGIVYKSDGCIFEGNWENGVLDGYGRYITAQKEYFVGNFIEGKTNGFGMLAHNNGTVYRGNWAKDSLSGEGEDIFIDGSRFKGFYANGKKLSGKFTWEDGSYYEGEILDDMFHGNGTYLWSEGRKYVGTWAKGQMDGKGLFTYLDGSYYEGDFHCGLRNGEGKYVWNSTKSYEGGWLNGHQHGKGKYIKNNRVTEGIWIQGKLKNTITVNSTQDYTSIYTCENNDSQPMFVNTIKK